MNATAATAYPQSYRAGQHTEQQELGENRQRERAGVQPRVRLDKRGEQPERGEIGEPVPPQRQVVEAESVPPHPESVGTR